jgi:hypothetical protein
MAPNFLTVLQNAKEEGISIDVMPWNDQHEGPRGKKTHALNQYMAINACLYWHMPYFEYSAVVDLDEYLTYRHGVVRELPTYLDELRWTHQNAAAFSFRHYLFRSKKHETGVGLPQAYTNNHDGLPIFDIFLLTERHGPLEPKVRSKVVVISDLVVTSSIHNIGEAVTGYDEIVVPVEDAALFHFRKQALSNALGNATQDLEMAKYAPSFFQHRLASRLIKELKERERQWE